MNNNQVSGAVVDAAMKVHSALGPGLLESAYAICWTHELVKRGYRVTREVPLPVVYDGLKLEAGYRLDMLVEETVIVELKAVETLSPIHRAQLISYLKLSGKPNRSFDKFSQSSFKGRDQAVCRLILCVPLCPLW
jgi:GxxExxY protein